MPEDAPVLKLALFEVAENVVGLMMWLVIRAIICDFNLTRVDGVVSLILVRYFFLLFLRVDSLIGLVICTQALIPSNSRRNHGRLLAIVIRNCT